MSRVLVASKARLELAYVHSVLLDEWGLDDSQVVLLEQGSKKYIFLIQLPLKDVKTRVEKHMGWTFGSILPDGSQWNLFEARDDGNLVMQHKHIRDIVLLSFGKDTKIFISL
jgi:hypothetical protein